MLKTGRIIKEKIHKYYEDEELCDLLKDYRDLRLSFISESAILECYNETINKIIEIVMEADGIELSFEEVEHAFKDRIMKEKSISIY